MKRYLFAAALAIVATLTTSLSVAQAPTAQAPTAPVVVPTITAPTTPPPPGVTVTTPTPSGGTVTVTAPPPSSVLDVGAAFGWLAPYVNTLVGGILSALVGWVIIIVKNKLNFSIDDSARDALNTFLRNQAGSLIAAGAVKINGLKVDVHSPTLAAAANLGSKLIPDTVARFGLTPDVLAQKIVDMIPHVPAAVAVMAATTPQAKPPLSPATPTVMAATTQAKPHA